MWGEAGWREGGWGEGRREVGRAGGQGEIILGND